MADLGTLLADPAPYMPHGMCLLWDPALIWTHLAADALTAGSYYSIPLAILVFVRRRRDLAYRWIFIMFALFILACGTTHLLGAWTLWQPIYVVEGVVKAVTAAISVATAIAIWPLLPRAIALPSPAQLHAANYALQAEVAERKKAEQSVLEANAALERRVAERTEEIERANRTLRDINETLEQRVVERTAALEEAVRALRESEVRYAGIVQNASDIIFTVDVAPDGTFRYGSVNPAFDRDTGLTADKVVGRTLADAFSPSVAEMVEARFAACVAARSRIQYEEVIESPTGVQFWQTALVPVVDPVSGRVAQLVGTSRNMTDYRALQQELAQASKLATLGTMAAGIAHEMSQPLNAIRITATDCVLLLEEEEAPDLSYLRLGLVTIRDQSARMGGIVDQMRQFGRPETPETSTFNPAGPARLAARLLAGQFAASGITLRTDIADHLPSVTGQPGKLEQVVINLLTNARDAIEEKRAQSGASAPGNIELTVAPAQAGRAVTIVVEDDGVGLSPGTAERIFDPFFTTKDSDKGMGLGLSISASIVGAMGGRIEAAPGAKGARFIVTLPVRQAALEAVS